MRRYSVQSLLALVVEDDDDGSAASGQLIRRRAVAASINGHAPEADVITGTGSTAAGNARQLSWARRLPASDRGSLGARFVVERRQRISTAWTRGRDNKKGKQVV
jgi:hypothetical protein